jgi:AhpD family alkylhydroperoxidase
MMREYPKLRTELQQLAVKLSKEIPGTMSGFSSLHKAALADGALTKKSKELIALGIAIAACCDGCIAYHVHDSIKAGASRQEVTEAIGVAILMGGGPAMVYGCEALAALEQFESGS